MNKHTVSADWAEFASGLRGWLAKPEGAESPPGALLYIEAFGVNAHMRNVAERYARAGFAAIVPDIFHGEVFDYDDMDGALGAVRNLNDEQVMRESVEALAALAEAGVAGNPAAIGFCMGGRLAFLAGLELGERLSAAVCYYGGGIGPQEDHFGRPILIERAAELAVPTLLHYGGRDSSISAAEHGRIAAALTDAGKRYALSVYPQAGHAFTNDDRESYHAASAAEAWELTQQFLARHRA
jgi:carboxymethylenebutenolidase